MMKLTTPETINLLGGVLCLDFANSVDWSRGEHVAPHATDVLVDGATVGRWGRRLGIWHPVDTPAPAVDAAEVARIRVLRDALHRLLAAIASGGAPAAGDLGLLAASYRDAVDTGLGLAPRDGAYRFEPPVESPRRLRHAVALDAVALLGEARRLGRVRLCPGQDCGWLFLDTSGRRRWCSMATCGSRSKMRALYRRRAAAA